MKKFLFILISTLLIVSVLAVPCFASNEGTYGHYISPGNYLFNNELDFSMFPYDYDEIYDLRYSIDGVAYSSIRIVVGSSGITLLHYRNADDEPVVSILVYDSRSGWVDDSYRSFVLLLDNYIYDASFYLWFKTNVTRIDSGYDSSILDEFLSAFTFVGQWISGAASDLTLMFWTGSELTFVGILAVSALAFAVSFLIIGLISRFLRFRG